MQLLFIALFFTSVFSLFGNNLRSELVQKADSVAEGVVAEGHKLILDPSKKRSADEVLLEDTDQEALQSDPSIVCSQSGTNNCTKCNFELSYRSCSICYSCCYSSGFGRNSGFYYDCTVCSTRYCYFCRSSLHSENGTCLDFTRYQLQGCTPENQYPLSCRDTVQQVYAQENTFKSNITNAIQTAWNSSTLQEINTTVRPVITTISSFVPISYDSNNNVTQLYFTISYSANIEPNLNQTDAMFSYINVTYAFYHNIQVRRVTYFKNTTATPFYFNVTISSGSKSLISILFLGLSMVFLLF